MKWDKLALIIFSQEKKIPTSLYFKNDRLNIIKQVF